MAGRKRGTWKYLWNEIYDRLCVSASQPSIVLYFILVVLIGGVGGWINTLKYLIPESVKFSVVVNSFSTFIIAIAASAATDISLDTSSSRSLQIASYSILAAITFSVIYIFSYDYFNISITVLIFFFTAITWMIANSTNANLKDPPPDTTTGGDTTKDLSGDLSDFKT